MSHNGCVTGPDLNAPAKRSAGRPRSEEASQAILAAVIDLVAEQGSFQTLSMEAVAARSGASKATIYRRWASKEELVGAALEAIKAKPLEFPHVSLRDDLLRLGHSIPLALSDKEHLALEVIMREAESCPRLRASHHASIARRREAARDMLRYWVEQGEVREDVDVSVAVAMMTFALRGVMVFNQAPDLDSPDLVERVVDHLLRGVERRD